MLFFYPVLGPFLAVLPAVAAVFTATSLPFSVALSSPLGSLALSIPASKLAKFIAALLLGLAFYNEAEQKYLWNLKPSVNSRCYC